MKKLILILIFVTFHAHAHCPLDFKAADLCAKITWVNGPFLGSTSHMELNFWEKSDSSHAPISPAFDVNIYSWMVMANGHSHGGPKFQSVEITPGIFETKDVRFFMGRMQGYWLIKIDLSENGNIISAAESEVSFK